MVNMWELMQTAENQVWLMSVILGPSVTQLVLLHCSRKLNTLPKKTPEKNYWGMYVHPHIHTHTHVHIHSVRVLQFTADAAVWQFSVSPDLGAEKGSIIWLGFYDGAGWRADLIHQWQKNK